MNIFDWIKTWFLLEARGRKSEEVRGCDKCEAAWTEQAGNKSSKFNGSAKFGVIGLSTTDWIQSPTCKTKDRKNTKNVTLPTIFTQFGLKVTFTENINSTYLQV